MGRQRLEDERLRTATDSARPLPAGVVEELLADLRRLEAEADEARAEQLDMLNL
jgi:hypothetical protein